MSKTIKHKKVKGKITTLKAMPYKDNMVYIRKIGEEIFEWLLIFENQLYSSYLIMKPKKGETKLTKIEIIQTQELLWSGAMTTIDTLLGVELEEEKKAIVDAFEKSRTNVERTIH